MKNSARAMVLPAAVAVLIAVAAYGLYYGSTASERLPQESARENAELKCKVAEQGAKIKELTAELAARDGRISELEERASALEKKAVTTYFLKKTSRAQTLPDGTFEQVIELEPRGENTIPLLSVIAQTNNETRITDLRVEGETVPPKSEREGNSSGTMLRVMYGSVKPAPIKITVCAEKDTPLDIIIDPFREI